MKKIVVITGAGISAESGISTFRDADGLWEGHDIMEVASPEGFYKNPALVLDFYNQRRTQLLTVQPNKAHLNLKKLEEHYEVTIVTQNVDDLHERAGSTNIIHLHGELLKVRNTKNESLIYDWRKDLVLGDVDTDGSQLRPHIVWFGEEVPMLEKAVEVTEQADIVIIIGTSMQVYPAASLINFAKEGIPIYFIDPKPSINKNAFNNLHIIKDVATLGTDKLLKVLT
ncbi:SIR2 family NAD-dependent protein deacylase [Tenacibaculum sp. M341]|uniref:SIR2 family NAD-dependent protein deacylase n=1 Tax=Tenacibaculum sp. M341 TaxID=2530339 RepID=UPI001049B8F0|nr:NAD-dependent deacylase [Tenacibaculum sp. M341]TCI84645.1 NAD-dependent deacylase [Tenacibaculum sp. M341]